MTVCKKATVQSVIESNLVISDSIENTVDSSSIQDSLYNLSNSLLVQGEESLSQAVALICHLSSMQLQFDESENPYRSVSFGSFISVNLSDLTGEHLRIIQEIEKNNTNVYLKARLCDILWIKMRPTNHEYARKSIRAHLELAEKIVQKGDKNASYAENYTLRAINLWKQIGKDQNIRIEIEKTLINLMKLDEPEPSDYKRFFFFKNLAICFKKEEVDKWIDMASIFIEDSVAQKNYEKARKYLLIKRQFLNVKRDRIGVAESRSEEVQLYIDEAEEVKCNGATPTMIQHFLNKAYEAARKVPNYE